MHLLKMEFYKLRHKKMGAMVIGIVLFQLIYMIWATRSMGEYELMQGWKGLMYRAFEINIILMPLMIAMMASRLSDIEHKGSTFKYLKTIVSSARLFDTKALCGASYLMGIVILQIGMLLLVGGYRQFGEAIPVGYLGYYLVITFMIDLTLFILQLNLSLIWSNQMIALIVAVVGTFLGLYSMFFSEDVARWILWGYYALLSPVKMNWDSTTRIIDFYWVSLPIQTFMILMAVLVMLYFLGKCHFVRKEQ